MVKKIVLILLLLSSLLSAGEFTASVRGKKVSLGKGFPLTLTLQDTNAKSSPNISELKNQFTIQSQQQSSSTIVTNGKLSSSMTWKYTLIPSKEGVFTIPSIGINTDEGILWTKPIVIEVITSNASQKKPKQPEDGFIITTHASKTNPYKDEPISYNVKFESRVPFANVQMDKMHIENAIIEMVKEPSVYNKIVDGVKMHILEYPLLITPLKPGTMVIPPTLIQGEVPAKEDSRPRSFFDEGFNPFQMIGRFGRTEPFAVRTDETILTVQPPIPGVQPWLPAASLKIEEQWENNEKLEVGEPITRNIRISAVGLRATQLPNLEGYIKSSENFKVYSDKPETEENLTGDNISSSRVEQFTIIPQKSGKIVLPSIEIPWWDVSIDTKAIAKLPTRNLDIKPATATPQIIPSSDPSGEVPEPTQVIVTETNTLLYMVIAGLAILVLLAFVWVLSLQKKIGRLSEIEKETEESTQEKKITIRYKELQTVKTPKELHEFLQNYSQDKWKAPKNATVKTVCSAIEKHLPNHLHDELKSIELNLENALYHDVETDIARLKRRCSMIL
ncbi:MAG: BatD family protein, partial [Chlamydiota bacterium]